MRNNVQTLSLTFAGGETIETTSEHPFYVQGEGFVPAGRLAIGNAIVTRAGPPSPVVEVVWNGVPKTVYNFTVEGDHTYFVGNHDGGLWVHNVNCKVYLADLTAGVGGGVKPGRQLTQAEALNAIRRGEDVITESRSAAKGLAKSASGNNRAIGPQIHGNPLDGFLHHFHPTPRNGSHIFYP